MKIFYRHMRFAAVHFLLVVVSVLIHVNVYAQQRSISGTVSDDRGNPVIGASVAILGKSAATRTDANGQFSLQAETGDVLHVTAIGYSLIEQAVDASSVYRITLLESQEELEEIVVVGYGTVRKRDLTGSMASVGSEAMKDRPVANIGEALQGRASGVQIVNSGSPGSNVSIQIRGLGSINNSAPLLVIDGVPTDLALNALNPNDVETIDILKDASATAIYGSRGANGVVLVTTKKGHKDKGTFTASANFATQEATSLPKMLNAAQFASLHNEMMANNNERQRPDFADPTLWGEGTDWTDALLRRDQLSNYSLSYSGGGEKNTYYVSGGILSQD